MEWRFKDELPFVSSSDTLIGNIRQSFGDAEDDGKCWGNGECQDCPKAKWSSSSLFTEESRIIGCAEEDGK